MTISLSHETIKLMLESKRYIKKEFGVNINLDDEQAIALFLAYASKSVSEEFKKCTDKLMLQLLPANKTSNEKVSPPGEKNNVKYYRGQRVVEATPVPVAQASEKTNGKRNKQVTYRGQTITI